MTLSDKFFSATALKHFFLMVSAFLLGFALPTSIALINLSYGLLVLSIIINHDFSRAINLLKKPLFYLPLLMFCLMVISLFYTQHEFAKVILNKYRKLLYIFPIALFFLQERRLILTTLKGFVAGNTIVLILSLLAWLLGGLFKIPAQNPTVFHLHITQNFFMAITCLIWLVLVFKTTGWQRVCFAILLLLGIFNVLFLVEGRTGYLAIMIGLGIWLWYALNNKQRTVLVILSVLFITVVSVVPNKAQDRLEQGVSEIQRCVGELDPTVATPIACKSSMGLRTEFAYRSWLLIQQSPLIGNGVGGFDYYSADGVYHHVNPHNEYLMQTLQSGVIGLMLFLAWLICLLRASFVLPDGAKAFCIAIVAIYLAGFVFNSFILDAYEGQFFAIFVACLAAEMVWREKPNKENKG